MNSNLRSGFAILAIVAMFAACDKTPPNSQAPATIPAASETTTNPAGASTNASATPVKPAFASLSGKWHRTDGDYLVHIKNIGPDGKLDVGYFNPNPINVSRAAAFEKDSSTQVFIELRDVNYPGCTYTLVYDPKTDQLFGQYFQAAMQETFDVTFERVKE